jgi:hypothetical protein
VQHLPIRAFETAMIFIWSFIDQYHGTPHPKSSSCHRLTYQELEMLILRKVSLAAFISALAVPFLAQPAIADDHAKFIGFVLKNAHEHGYSQCDGAIRKAFSNAGGVDMRVTVGRIGETVHDSAVINVVYGEPGDVIQEEGNFRKLGTSCIYSLTSTLTKSKNCKIVMRDSADHWKFTAETIGVIFAENNGGVVMMLTPVGDQGCVVTYRLTSSAP